MWRKLSHHKTWASVLAGAALVLSFAPIDLLPLVFLFPLLLSTVSVRAPSFGSGFRFGFLCSLIIMLGAFYWVVYVIHEFGYLPWAVSGLIFLGFCGFGALNFPIFLALASWIHRRVNPATQPPVLVSLWFALGLPALYTIVEFLVPKLFPWYVGHFVYRFPWLMQIVELTGSTYLSFAIYSTGSVLSLYLLSRTDRYGWWKPVWLIPLALWAIDIGFSVYRLSESPPPNRELRVALIQANIGSLEKVAAEKGIYRKVRYVLDRYKRLTSDALSANPKPELIIWPETAVPFQLASAGPLAQEIRDAVLKWQVPLIAGAYAQSRDHFDRDYNAAFLLDPKTDGTLRMDMYPKNILLAFGEYMPFGDDFPWLYKEFPQVSNFERGHTQNPFTLSDGTRLGVTICYEDIVPEFFRKVASEHVQGVVNLTNDSWFGPTSEPYQHGALSVFRAVEFRIPLMRVTNTGISFTVDTYGRMSRTTGVYKEGVLQSAVQVPLSSPETIYLKFGEWFIIVCTAVLATLLILLQKRKNVSVSF